MHQGPVNVAIILAKFAEPKESEDLLEVDERRRTGRTERTCTDGTGADGSDVDGRAGRGWKKRMWTDET